MSHPLRNPGVAWNQSSRQSQYGAQIDRSGDRSTKPPRPKNSSESAAGILQHFGLDLEDLELLITFPKELITPSKLPPILRQIHLEKRRKKAAAAQAKPQSEPQPTRELGHSLYIDEDAGFIQGKTAFGVAQVIQVHDSGSAKEGVDDETERTFYKDSGSYSEKVMEIDTANQISKEPVRRSVSDSSNDQGSFVASSAAFPGIESTDQLRIQPDLTLQSTCTPKKDIDTSVLELVPLTEPEEDHHPSIHPFSTAYPVQGCARLEPIPAVYGREAGFTLDRSPGDHQSESNTQLTLAQSYVTHPTHPNLVLIDQNDPKVTTKKNRPQGERSLKVVEYINVTCTQRREEVQQRSMQQTLTIQNQQTISHSALRTLDTQSKVWPQAHWESLISVSSSGYQTVSNKQQKRKMIRDYSGASISIFPHTCSLCNKECAGLEDWQLHRSSSLHLMFCTLLKKTFPEWVSETESRPSNADKDVKPSTSAARQDSRYSSSSSSKSPSPYHGRGSRCRRENRRNQSHSPRRSRQSPRSRSGSSPQQSDCQNSSGYQSSPRSRGRRSSPRRRRDERRNDRMEDKQSSKIRSEDICWEQRRLKGKQGAPMREEDKLSPPRREEDTFSTRRREEDKRSTRRMEADIRSARRREEDKSSTRRMEEDIRSTRRREEDKSSSPRWEADNKSSSSRRKDTSVPRKEDNQPSVRKMEDDKHLPKRPEDDQPSVPRKEDNQSLVPRKEHDQPLVAKMEDDQQLTPRREEDQHLGPTIEDDQQLTTRKEEDQPSIPRKEDDQPSVARKKDNEPSVPRKEDNQPSLPMKEDDRPSVAKMEDDQHLPPRREDDQHLVPRIEDDQQLTTRKEEDQPSVPRREDNQPSVTRKDDDQPSVPRKEDDHPSVPNMEDDQNLTRGFTPFILRWNKRAQMLRPMHKVNPLAHAFQSQSDQCYLDAVAPPLSPEPGKTPPSSTSLSIERGNELSPAASCTRSSTARMEDRTTIPRVVRLSLRKNERTKVSPPTMVKLHGIGVDLSHTDVVAAVEKFGKTKSVLLFRSQLEANVCFENEDDAKKLRSSKSLNVKGATITVVSEQRCFVHKSKKVPSKCSTQATSCVKSFKQSSRDSSEATTNPGLFKERTSEGEEKEGQAFVKDGEVSGGQEGSCEVKSTRPVGGQDFGECEEKAVLRKVSDTAMGDSIQELDGTKETEDRGQEDSHMVQMDNPPGKQLSKDQALTMLIHSGNKPATGAGGENVKELNNKENVEMLDTDSEKAPTSKDEQNLHEGDIKDPDVGVSEQEASETLVSKEDGRTPVEEESANQAMVSPVDQPTTSGRIKTQEEEARVPVNEEKPKKQVGVVKKYETRAKVGKIINATIPKESECRTANSAQGPAATDGSGRRRSTRGRKEDPTKVVPLENQRANVEPTITTRSTRGRRGSTMKEGNVIEDTPTRTRQTAARELRSRENTQPVIKAGEDPAEEVVDSVEDNVFKNHGPTPEAKGRRGRPKKKMKTTNEGSKAPKKDVDKISYGDPHKKETEDQISEKVHDLPPSDGSGGSRRGSLSESHVRTQTSVKGLVKKGKDEDPSLVDDEGQSKQRMETNEESSRIEDEIVRAPKTSTSAPDLPGKENQQKVRDEMAEEELEGKADESRLETPPLSKVDQSVEDQNQETLVTSYEEEDSPGKVQTMETLRSGKRKRDDSADEEEKEAPPLRNRGFPKRKTRQSPARKSTRGKVVTSQREEEEEEEEGRGGEKKPADEAATTAHEAPALSDKTLAELEVKEELEEGEKRGKRGRRGRRRADVKGQEFLVAGFFCNLCNVFCPNEKSSKENHGDSREHKKEPAETSEASTEVNAFNTQSQKQFQGRGKEEKC